MKTIALSWITVASFTFCLTSSAEAQVTTKPTAIVGWSSGKCVNVEGASQDDAARMIQWVCDSSANSAFTLEPYGDAYRVIASHSGKCLIIEDASTASGANAIQSHCVDGAANELWYLEPFNSTYRLHAKHSGKCLVVFADQRSNGTKLIQYDCVGSENELWSFGEGFVAAGQAAHLLTATRKCVDVKGDSLNQGAEVQQFPCKRAPRDTNQSFTLQRLGDAYRVIAQHSGQCLGVAAASTANGAKIVQTTCNNADHQLWQIQRVGAAFRLTNKASGRCLDTESSATDAPLVQRTCAGTASQSFQVSVTSKLGMWSNVTDLPLVPVAAAMLKNGRVMLWSAFDEFTFGGGNATETVQFDPTTGTPVSSETVNTGHEMFCPGTALLPDGELLVNGGASASQTTIYDVNTKTWRAAPVMNIARGYNADTVLDTGEVFTIGGSWSGPLGGKSGEVFSLATGWRLLAGAPADPMTGPDPQGVYRGDNHAWLFSVGGGKVFHAGPSAQMNWYDTAGAGCVTLAGNRADDPYSINGNAIMYDVAKILKVGGAPAYEKANATGASYVIDIRSGVTVTKTGSLTYPRAFLNSVVLPDGRVLVVGGQSYPEPFTDSHAPLTAEIWNPAAGRFAVGASMTVPRTYHSVGLLLPDGRVLVGGGGLCGTTCDNNHANVQLYSPDYLFAPNGQLASRPAITSAPNRIAYNTTVQVNTNATVDKFSLVRLSSVTHSTNNDQRRVPLAIVARSGTSYTMATPANSGVATPGYYMLFALDADGVPSPAAIVQIK